MSDDNNIDLDLELKKAKILEQKQKFAQEKKDISWQAVARPDIPPEELLKIKYAWENKKTSVIDFHGKNLEKGSFTGENFENANFSAANLKGIDLSGANLRGVDFSGADLSGANLEGADLTGAILTNAKLVGANLKRVKLKEAKLEGVDLTDAVFLEIDIDNLTLEELQELVEYLATYYPHKLNLAKFDLKLLDLKRIDLTHVNLRGVDFTGVDFTGVNISELDLSECIITPEQIAQALGRTPSPEELKKILAPKPKKKAKAFFIDMTDFFFDNGIPAGVWDTRRGKGTTFDQIFSAVKRFTNAFKRDDKEDFKTKEAPAPEKSSNEDLRRIIEENKKNTLEEKAKEETHAPSQKAFDQKVKTQMMENLMMRQRGENSRG